MSRLFLPSLSFSQILALSPLCVIAGVMLAYRASFVTYWGWGVGGAMLAAMAVALRAPRFLPYMVCVVLVLIGGMRWQQQLAHHHPLTLSKSYRFVAIEGVIDQAEAMQRGQYRLHLRDITSPVFQARDNGVTARLTVRTPLTLHAGDRIALRATLFPPSRPAIAGGADFARYFFTKEIGAVGYAVGKVTHVTLPLQAGGDGGGMFSSLTTHFTTLRHSIDTLLLTHLLQPEAGIAIAMTTGGRAAIDKTTDEAMRVAGITHILSISGLHMTIICGLLYAAVRYGLACIPYLALHHPIKKYAAIVGLISGAMYLALADFPIPAIRAYTMIALMFLAILCNREADALRSLILAALAIILISPLTVLDVGFQLSFIATWALIIAYRRAKRLHQSTHEKGWGWGARAVLYPLNIAFSSLIAGLATAPLMLFHFGFLSSYSILANMLTLPILSLSVMPSLIIGLWVAPFADASFPLAISGYGLHSIVEIAQWVAGLPESRLALPQLSFMAMLGMTIGMVALLLARRWWVIAGAIAVIGLTGWSGMRFPAPLVLMAEDSSAIAVQVEVQKWLLLRGSAGNFFVKQWQQATGGEFISYATARKAGTLYGFLCDKQGCDGEVAGMTLRARFDYRDPAPLCLPETSISLASFYAKRQECPSAQWRIERDALERFGSHILNLTPKGALTLWHPCKGNKHPWLRCGV